MRASDDPSEGKQNGGEDTEDLLPEADLSLGNIAAMATWAFLALAGILLIVIIVAHLLV